PSFDTIIGTRAHQKGAEAKAIAAAVRQANPQADVRIAATIEDAVATSQQLATSQQQKIYVAGGLFVGIEYAVVARGGRAQELDFFLLSLSSRHCEEQSDEAIHLQPCPTLWIASRSLSSGAHSRDPLARNDV